MAIDLIMRLFTTQTRFDHGLHARRTSSKMTLKSTFMATRQNLLTRAPAGWLNSSTFDWWINLLNTTRTEEWLSRVNFARLAWSNMAEVIALMNTTCQSFIAFQKTHVQSVRVWSFSCWAAHLLTLMSLAFLAHVTDFIADEDF